MKAFYPVSLKTSKRNDKKNFDSIKSVQRSTINKENSGIFNNFRYLSHNSQNSNILQSKEDGFIYRGKSWKKKYFYKG